MPGTKTAVSMKKLIIALPAFLILSFVNYTLANVFNYISINKSQAESVLSDAGKDMQAMSQSSDNIQKIQVGLRIMPSQNAEHGLYPMTREQPAKTQFSSLMDSTAKDMLIETEDASESSFSWSDTSSFFPNMYVDQEHMPIGKGKPYCIHLDWIRKDNALLTDQYYYVQGMSECKLATSVKARWNDEDPKTGVDFYPWKQTVTESSSDSCPTPNSFYIKRNGNNGGKCYSYEYLDGICLLIQYVEQPESGTFQWEYARGCFENGEIAHYSPASSGQKYEFDSVPIEVHQVASDEVKSENKSFLWSSVSLIFTLLGFICLIGGLAVGIFIAITIYQKYKGQQQENHGNHMQFQGEPGMD